MLKVIERLCDMLFSELLHLLNSLVVTVVYRPVADLWKALLDLLESIVDGLPHFVLL